MSGLFVSVLPVLTPHLCSASSAYMARLGSGLAFDRSSILAIHTPTSSPLASCTPWACMTASIWMHHTSSFAELHKDELTLAKHLFVLGLAAPP